MGNLATKMIQAILPGSGTPAKPPGSATIGRANDNDIVIQDVLASRHHAFLVQSPLGTEIRDAHSVNGTFVNGVRVGSAVLNEGDVVTIGNVDLVFTDGNLIRRTEAATRTGGLEVNGVHFKIDGKELLDNISLTARPGTLTAIIGGSGAGKTTLSRLIAGYTRPSAGSVTFEGHNIHAEYATMRSRIGMVPQDDVVHRQLTVNQALGYAAELRLPPDTSKQERAQVVAQVLEELDLTKHADTRVDKLSGGQRKRASVALELLTQPSLLLLDEPTSGLDPALDRQVMLMLRQLADAGRVVLVVTHSVSYLDVCDQILLVAPGGKTAFNGPPSQVGAALGTTNWADIFANVGADPDEANRRFIERDGRRQSASPRAGKPGGLGRTGAHRPGAPVLHDCASSGPTRRLRSRLLGVPGGTAVLDRCAVADRERPQTGTRSRRPARAGADPTAVHHGPAQYRRRLHGHGVDHSRPDRRASRSSAGNRRSVCPPRPTCSAKVFVFFVFATAQAAIATFIVRLGKGAPTAHPPFFDNSTFSLFVTVAGTCVASAILGLMLSAVAQSNEQIMPLLVVSIMSQLVLAGGMIPVTGRAGLNQLSWVTPGRWGYAAGASSIDFPNLVKVKQIPTNDPIWQHSKHIYLFDMAMLAALSLFYAATCAGISGSSAEPQRHSAAGRCQACQGVLADRDQGIGRRSTVAGIDVDHRDVFGQGQRLAHLGNGIPWGAVELVDRDKKWQVAMFEEVDRGEAVLQAPAVHQDDRADRAAHQVVPHEPESALPWSTEQVEHQILVQGDPAEIHRYRGGAFVRGGLHHVDAYRSVGDHRLGSQWHDLRNRADERRLTGAEPARDDDLRRRGITRLRMRLGPSLRGLVGHGASFL